VLVTYQDGTETKVHFFASRLKYSRWVEVTLVPNERVELTVPIFGRFHEDGVFATFAAFTF
jgi:hypothetical protein